MKCPACGGEVVERRCVICPGLIHYKDLFQIIADNISDVQIQNVVNFIVDLGFQVEYAPVKNGMFTIIFPEETKQ